MLGCENERSVHSGQHSSLPFPVPNYVCITVHMKAAPRNNYGGNQKQIEWRYARRLELRVLYVREHTAQGVQMESLTVPIYITATVLTLTDWPSGAAERTPSAKSHQKLTVPTADVISAIGILSFRCSDLIGKGCHVPTEFFPFKRVRVWSVTWY